MIVRSSCRSSGVQSLSPSLSRRTWRDKKKNKKKIAGEHCPWKVRETILSLSRDRSNPRYRASDIEHLPKVYRFLSNSLKFPCSHDHERETRDRDIAFSRSTIPFAQVTPISTRLLIRTMIKLPKLGLMLVGWGGNNGSTVTAALLANKLKLSWETKEGPKIANWYVLRRFLYLFYAKYLACEHAR